MAPEQWDGAPATPATDIYAATAVFFECLTGMTPFSGGLGQLAAQHAAAAVPVELVDEPLRELIARGMAKDPAARPASAPRSSPSWRPPRPPPTARTGRPAAARQLAERAAALLLLLLPHGPGRRGGQRHRHLHRDHHPRAQGRRPVPYQPANRHHRRRSRRNRCGRRRRGRHRRQARRAHVTCSGTHTHTHSRSTSRTVDRDTARGRAPAALGLPGRV